MSDWRETTIGDMIASGAASLQTGPFGSQLHAHDYVASGTPVIPTEAIGRRTLMEQGLPQVSPATVERLARHVVRDGDILFARRGVQATGLSALVQSRHAGWLCGTGAILLRVDRQRVDPSFVSFALADRSAIDWLKAHAVGAVMPNLNTDVISRLPLVLPALAEQRRIAEVLGALDDKIELNWRTIDTLDCMLRMLFARMELEHDSPRPPRCLGDIAQLVRDGVSPGREPDRMFSHFSIPAFDAELQPVRETGAAILSNKFVVPAGSVLLSKLNPSTERVWVPNVNDADAAVCSTEFLVFVPQSCATRAYLYGLLTSTPFRTALCSTVTGTSNSHQRVRPDDVLAIHVSLPSRLALAQFDAVGAPLLERIQQARDENRTLAELRDTLLPCLLSGDLRVRYEERELAQTP